MSKVLIAEHQGGRRSWRTYTTPGKSIEVHLHGPEGDLQHVRSFKVGDEAEYDSRWVGSDGPLGGHTEFYMGTIMGITPKSVTVRGTDDRRHRVNLGDFSFRNWNEKSPRNV